MDLASLLEIRGKGVAWTSNLTSGTLDTLKAVSLGPLHGYGVLLRIQQVSGDQLEIQQGSLYPAFTAMNIREPLPASGGI